MVAENKAEYRIHERAHYAAFETPEAVAGALLAYANELDPHPDSLRFAQQGADHIARSCGTGPGRGRVFLEHGRTKDPSPFTTPWRSELEFETFHTPDGVRYALSVFRQEEKDARIAELGGGVLGLDRIKADRSWAVVEGSDRAIVPWADLVPVWEALGLAPPTPEAFVDHVIEPQRHAFGSKERERGDYRAFTVAAENGFDVRVELDGHTLAPAWDNRYAEHIGYEQDLSVRVEGGNLSFPAHLHPVRSPVLIDNPTYGQEIDHPEDVEARRKAQRDYDEALAEYEAAKADPKSLADASGRMRLKGRRDILGYAHDPESALRSMEHEVRRRKHWADREPRKIIDNERRITVYRDLPKPDAVRVSVIVQRSNRLRYGYGGPEYSISRDHPVFGPEIQARMRATAAALDAAFRPAAEAAPGLTR